MGTLEELDRCCSRLTSGSSDESLAAARSLRNSCAGNKENALHLIETNVIEWIAIHCREVALLKLGDQCGAGSSQSSSSIKHRQSFILALCQFLSNFAACGERPSHYLWSNAFGAPGFSDLLAASVTVKSRNATAAVISSMHNSLKQMESKLNHEQNDGMKKLCCSRSLSAHLLLSAAPSTQQLQELASTTHATSQPNDSTTDSSKSPSDPVIDWLHILFFHLLSSKDNNIQRMFLVLKARSITESVWAPISDDSNDGVTSQPIDCYYYDNNEIFRNSEQAVLTHEQIILLQIVLTIFEDTDLADKLIEIDYPSDEKAEEVTNVEALRRKSVTEDFLVTVAVLTNVLYERHNANKNNDVTTADTEGDESVVVKALRYEDYSELLLLCLSVIGAGVSYHPRDPGSAFRGVIGAERTKLLHMCCCILKDNDATKIAYMAKKVEDRKRHQEALVRDQNKEDLKAVHQEQHHLASASSVDIDLDDSSRNHISSKVEGGSGNRDMPYLLTAEEEKEGELVKAALQVIGNLAYGCSSVQDALRESGGLALCLSHCSTDFRLPFAREWGLFSLRNICEGNKQNQDFISALQPQKIVQDDYLQSLGVSVHIDPQTGKISATSALDSSPS